MPSLRKITGIPQQDTGVGFYRITQPLRMIERAGLVDSKIWPLTDSGKRKKNPTKVEYENYLRYGCHQLPLSGENKMQDLPIADRFFKEITNRSDIIFSTLMWTDEQILKMMNLREFSGAKWVVDIDDNMYAVPKDNPVAPDVSRMLSNIQKCLMAADGLTTTVPTLANVYKQLNSNIHIIPNGIDFKMWDPLRRLKKKHKNIRIGWEGAYGHQADLELALPAVRAIKKDYPDVEFVSFGYHPKDFHEEHEWVSAHEYPTALANLNLDINLAPLVDSAYNRGKSNLRLLEASALKVPTIYSPTINYNGMPGMPARNNHEWYEMMATLIEDANLRQKLGKNAYDYTKKHYNAQDFAKPLADFFINLPRKQYTPE